jgi:chromosome segregation ATPase
MTQQLKTMASDLADAQRNLGQLPDITRNLADTRRSLGELAAKQEQIAQSIATLERFEQDVKQRLASAPQSRSVPLPPRKPTQQSAAQSSAVEASSVPAAVLSTQQRLPLR